MIIINGEQVDSNIQQGITIIDSIKANDIVVCDGPIEVTNGIGDGAKIEVTNGNITVHENVGDRAKIKTFNGNITVHGNVGHGVAIDVIDIKEGPNRANITTGNITVGPGGSVNISAAPGARIRIGSINAGAALSRATAPPPDRSIVVKGSIGVCAILIAPDDVSLEDAGANVHIIAGRDLKVKETGEYAQLKAGRDLKTENIGHYAQLLYAGRDLEANLVGSDSTIIARETVNIQTVGDGCEITAKTAHIRQVGSNVSINQHDGNDVPEPPIYGYRIP